MLATTSKGNHSLNLQNQSDLEFGKTYLWYIGSKELNSTYSYVVCANTKENALKINPYPGEILKRYNRNAALGIYEYFRQCAILRS